MEMDNNHLLQRELLKERQKAALLSQEIRNIREGLAGRTRLTTETLSEFPAGSLGQKYGTIGVNYKTIKRF
jgi:hypothetical protein